MRIEREMVQAKYFCIRISTSEIGLIKSAKSKLRSIGKMVGDSCAEFLVAIYSMAEDKMLIGDENFFRALMSEIISSRMSLKHEDGEYIFEDGRIRTRWKKWHVPMNPVAFSDMSESLSSINLSKTDFVIGMSRIILNQNMEQQ